MALDENKANRRSDEDYIFLNKSGERMHEYAVNNVLRRCNGVRNENDRFIISGKPSGNHAIRKTCISQLHDSQCLSDRTIADVMNTESLWALCSSVTAIPKLQQ